MLLPPGEPRREETDGPASKPARPVSISALEDFDERLAEARAPQENALMNALAEWDVRDIHNLTRLLHALTAGEAPEV